MGDILETSQLGLDEIQQELTAHDELILDDDEETAFNRATECFLIWGEDNPFREGSD